MSGATFVLLRRRRWRVIAVFVVIVLGLAAFASEIGFDLESSDFGSPVYRWVAGLGAASGFVILVSELIGLRHTEIVVSEEGIVAPHGWGRRPISLAWDEVAELEVYRVPHGEVLSLRPAEGKTMRIGLAEVDDPDGLWEVVAARWDAAHGDTA